jgi:hypothetical protein
MRMSSVRSYWQAASAAFTDTVGLDRLGPRQQILFALSAANLNLIWQWRETIYASPADQFSLFWPLGTHNLVALLALLALLAALIYVLVRVVYRLPARWKAGSMGALVLILTLNPINALRKFVNFTLFGNELWMGFAIAALLLLLILRARWTQTLFLWGILIFSPLTLLNVGRAAIMLGQPTQGSNSTPPTLAPAPRASVLHRRVVWLLFDELDNRILSQQLEELPHFKNLMQTSVVATKAIPPGGPTIRAVPALLTGRPNSASRPAGPARLLLTPIHGGPPAPLLAQDTVFARLTSNGARVAISGWTFPYCRMFSEVSVWCRDRLLHPMRSHVAKTFLSGLGTWIATLYPISTQQNRHRNYVRMISDAHEIADVDYNVAYMHLSVPHSPWYWHPRQTDMLTAGIEIGYDMFVGKTDGYRNNLRLADELLGEILESLRSNAAWNEATLIIASDHGLRVATRGWPSVFDSPRGQWGNPGDVVLIVHLPGQTTALAIDAPVDSLATAALIEAAWNGTIKAPADVVKTLQSNAPRREQVEPDPATLD